MWDSPKKGKAGGGGGFDLSTSECHCHPITKTVPFRTTITCMTIVRNLLLLPGSTLFLY